VAQRALKTLESADDE